MRSVGVGTNVANAAQPNLILDPAVGARERPPQPVSTGKPGRFFDIDEPISDHGGAVLSYVGDEVIVTWYPTRNARCLTCFFAIEAKIAGISNKYKDESTLYKNYKDLNDWVMNFGKVKKKCLKP